MRSAFLCMLGVSLLVGFVPGRIQSAPGPETADVAAQETIQLAITGMT